jgi:hypothetical protein
MPRFVLKVSMIFISLLIVGLMMFWFSPAAQVKAQESNDPCAALESLEAVATPKGSVDIEAAITNQWGSDAPPIKICRRDAAVGEIVTATLKEYDEAFALRAFEDPFPVHSACPGYGYFRDADMSIISRVTLGNWRDLIVIRHAGGRGNYPGSEGYVQMVGEYYIVDVLSEQGPNNSYFGFGLNIDPENGRVEWQGRGGCPACACLENDIKIALVVERVPMGPIYTPFTSTRTTSADVEASITHQWGHGAPPIKIFGQDAGVGHVVTAPLNEYDEKYALRAFEDPKADFSACPGYGYLRDGNMSVISRITLGSGRVLILVMHVGARGYHPGSEGYVQLGNDWEIEKITSAGNDNYSYGYGVRIDQENGTIEWQGRTGCPACACHEGPAFISVVVKKQDAPIISSIEPESGTVRTVVTIVGSHFGATEGTVTFNGVEADEITTWTDTEIITKVPPGATTGPVVVYTAEGRESNGVTFTVQDVEAAVNFEPNTLNRKSKGKWVTAYIELPQGSEVGEINVSTVAITEVNEETIDTPIYAALKPFAIGDHDADGVMDLMVKFDRKTLIQLVSPGNCVLTVTGQLNGGTPFTGNDSIKVIH